MLLHSLNCTGQPPENYLAQMSILLKLRNPELKGKQTKSHRGTKGSFLNYYLFHVFNNLEKEIDLSSHTHFFVSFPFWIWLTVSRESWRLFMWISLHWMWVGPGSFVQQLWPSSVASFLSGFQNSVLAASFVKSSMVAENSFVGHHTHPSVRVCHGSFLHKC